MDLVRPFIVGLGCCAGVSLVGLVVLTPLLAWEVRDPAFYLLISAPVLVGAFVGAGLAARSHREPERRDHRRHLVAALSAPGVFAVVNSVGVAGELDTVWLVRALNLLLPVAAGFAGLRLLDRRSRAPSW